MTLPAVIYLAVLGGVRSTAGWGMVIATDTAFAVALLVCSAIACRSICGCF